MEAPTNATHLNALQFTTSVHYILIPCITFGCNFVRYSSYNQALVEWVWFCFCAHPYIPSHCITFHSIALNLDAVLYACNTWVCFCAKAIQIYLTGMNNATYSQHNISQDYLYWIAFLYITFHEYINSQHALA